MNVKNITLNCHKPRHFGNLGDSSKVESSSGVKKQYKRYSEIDNDTLMLKSVLKAHNDVQKSSKMKLYKAMPQITAGIIGTALAITQPGKLSSKIDSGLGFLVATGLLFGFSDKIKNFMDKNSNKQTEQEKPFTSAFIKTGLTVAGATAATYTVLRGGVKAVDIVKKSSGKFAKILKSDGTKLIDEINSSKLGKFVQNSVIPFQEKNASKMTTVKNIAPFAAMAGGIITHAKLRNSIAQDIKEQSQINYLKGKLIQQKAREQYESIDAIEA